MGREPARGTGPGRGCHTPAGHPVLIVKGPILERIDMTGGPAERHPGLEARFAEAWRDHRRFLLDLAYRMLGSITDAEDVVQEAFARLTPEALDGIDDVRGWLVVVVSRLCLDQLRSARVRHEAYVGPWLPEPL